MGPTQVRRRPAAGGYARGEETRLRIVQAALELFGANGYERTSTREIAARAGVNPPALQYYFDSKEGLYLACVEHMSAEAWKVLEPEIEAVRLRMADDGVDREGLIDCVCRIHARSADFLLMPSEVETWIKFMAWEEGGDGGAPSIACGAIDNGVKREIRELLCILIGRIIGKPADDPETRIRMVTLGGQISIFNMARGRALLSLGWSDIDPEGLALIKTIVRAQTEAALRAAAPSQAVKS
jgi:AcrR family transcriptional regulator